MWDYKSFLSEVRHYKCRTAKRGLGGRVRLVKVGHPPFGIEYAIHVGDSGYPYSREVFLRFQFLSRSICRKLGVLSLEKSGSLFGSDSDFCHARVEWKETRFR